MRQNIILCALAGILLTFLHAQKKTGDHSELRQALDDKNYSKAQSIIKSETERFLALANYDTLVYLIPFIGELNNAQNGAGKAAGAINGFIGQLKEKKASPRTLVNAYRTAADFFATVGQSKHGYDASKASLEQTLLDPKHTDLDIARCEYNLGVYAYRLGDIKLSLPHHRRAMQIRQSNSKTDPEDIYLSANAIGALMWNASKYDSATHYYNNALDALSKMPPNDLNKYFRPGNVYNNLAALYSAQGQTSEGIKAMQNTISSFQKFIASGDAGPRKQSATEGLYEAMDNLAGIYKEVGDFGKAGELLLYSYNQKLQKLDPAHQGIFISEILLGQYFRDIHEYDSARIYLANGIEKLEKAEGDYLFWAADAYYSLALMNEDQKQVNNANQYYKKSEELYEQSYQGEYDNVYMDFLRSASVFYAKNNQYQKAIERAYKAYDYLLSVGEGGSLQAFYQLLNIAEINYLSKRYKEAIRYSENAMNTINAKMKEGLTQMDSAKMEVFQPKAILISAKSSYELGNKRDTTFLKTIAKKLSEGLSMLEKRKVLIDDEKSINILISDNGELINFAKEIELSLYNLTGVSSHLDNFINLHESALYTRIRGRLDKENAIRFTGLPAEVQQEEIDLKKALTAGSSKNFLKAVDKWEEHLAKVKKNFPVYYNMRYATIFKPLSDMQSLLPDSTTIIRYYVSDSAIQALVINRTTKNFVQLKNAGVAEKINTLLSPAAGEKLQLQLLHDLYSTIWQPLEKYVTTKKVLIIPDGLLFNLSFDMLTPQPASTFKELLSNSLLPKHVFSYHYSLFMLDKHSGTALEENYVAFAPGFSDELKQQYLGLIKDSVDLDHKYLQLLPQPNTNKLAKKIRSLLGGQVFLDTNSTQASFRNNARGHKIIHIATHAQYNNINPERSGLVFAKNNSGDDNFVSLYELYNCDMESELTLLTACESGKPGYQDGEGMVSLAHAFNYAGSESILTSLWEIDEQSCNRITELFVDNIRRGKPTDVALRDAKITYLEKYDGRILAPSYWAGLILMGQPTTIELKKSVNYAGLITASLLFATFVTVLVVRKRKRAQRIRQTFVH
ncbi:MAG: CHAT domain-containing protein [Chitinophagaceae bacterium]|nr:CHAT domain-containing protein [Chitinophagaceae bacterium]